MDIKDNCFLATFRHVENSVASILHYSLELPLPKLWVIFRHLVALQHRHHIIVGGLPNLFSDACHTLLVLLQESDQVGAHCMYFPCDRQFLLQDHLSNCLLKYSSPIIITSE